jgi:Uncharacterized alpha/beta hydrolase domain (DUF2235)
MTEFCEGVQPPAIEKEEPRKDDKKPVNVRCILLFDGTMNNKTNIASRETPNEFYEATRSKKYKLFGPRVGKGGDSYENGYTNIATLDKHIEDKPENGYDDYDFVVKVYTEGAGTMDNEKDHTAGYAIGMGDAGVIKKCEKGIREAVSKIITTAGKSKKAIDPETQYIKDLTIDVFGFSRGAATARYCIHKALKDDKWQLKKLLAAKQIDTTEVRVWFAGLFDTVSSHGVSFSNDTRKLELDAVTHATKTLHLVAGEEYRKNFSITNVKSAGGKGEEYFMPGVHSDVGGSYLELTDETFGLNSGGPDEIKQDKENLIAEGWYTTTEIDHYISYDEMGYESYASITANRKAISNAYCNIPLKLMARGAKNQKIVFKDELKKDADAFIAKADTYFGNTDLSTLDASIASYMPTTQDAFNVLIQAPLLKRIRHSYLHMSSKDSIGLNPRFKEGKRWRQAYDG